MTSQFIAEHRCHYAVLVIEDDLGWWRYAAAVPGHPGTFLDLVHCPRCRRRLTRRSLLVLDRAVRSEEGRR